MGAGSMAFEGCHHIEISHVDETAGHPTAEAVGASDELEDAQWRKLPPEEMNRFGTGAEHHAQGDDSAAEGHQCQITPDRPWVWQWFGQRAGINGSGDDGPLVPPPLQSDRESR